MLRSMVTLGMLAFALLFAKVGADEPAKKVNSDPKAANSGFENFKKLVGEWQMAQSKDDATKGKTIARYQLTAGGSVVVETLFPGEAKEMVTVYHRDGERLILTHYCHCGNQPRMCAKDGDKNELVFEFAGGTNLNPATDTHMHNCRFKFVDADRLQTEWELYIDGKSAAKYGFELVRKK